MATSVTVTIDGKPINVTGAAAKVILFIIESMALINSRNASGVIQLHIGGAEENVKAKYEISPVVN